MLAKDLGVPLYSFFFPSQIPCPVIICCLLYLQSVSQIPFTSVKVLCDLGPLSPHSSHTWPPCWHTNTLNVLPHSGPLCWAVIVQITRWLVLTFFRSLLKYHLIRKTSLTILYKLFYARYNPVPPYPFYLAFSLWLLLLPIYLLIYWLSPLPRMSALGQGFCSLLLTAVSPAPRTMCLAHSRCLLDICWMSGSITRNWQHWLRLGRECSGEGIAFHRSSFFVF